MMEMEEKDRMLVVGIPFFLCLASDAINAIILTYTNPNKVSLQSVRQESCCEIVRHCYTFVATSLLLHYTCFDHYLLPNMYIIVLLHKFFFLFLFFFSSLRRLKRRLKSS
jgi:hypothetical protein